MTSQNHRSHAPLHRRKGSERRQVAGEAETTKAPVRVTRTRTPVKPPVKTPVKPTVKPTAVPAPAAVTTPTPRLPVAPTTPATPPSISTPVASVVPSTTSSPLPPSTTNTTTSLHSTTSRAIPSPAISTKSSASPTPATPPSSSGGVSTGAVVGGIIGGFVVLGLIGAALFLFLRRAKEKKEREEKMFDANQFRRSAVLLDDPAEKHGKPRPPTMIEQLSQHRPSPASAPYPPSSSSRYQAEQTRYGSPYASPSPYGSAYPGAYGAQAAYGQQYPKPPSAYAYANTHGYPPHPQYPDQSPYGAQQYDAYPPSVPSSHQADSSQHGHDNMVLPNPFAASPSPDPETMPTHNSSSPSSMSTGRDLTHSALSVQNRGLELDTEAPPAYDFAGKFADFKSDAKVKPESSAAGGGGGSSGAAASSISQSPMTNAVDSTPQTSTSSSDSPTALTSAAGPPTLLRPPDGKALPVRPVSGTSAITTVYDANDAYGGM